MLSTAHPAASAALPRGCTLGAPSVDADQLQLLQAGTLAWSPAANLLLPSSCRPCCRQLDGPGSTCGLARRLLRRLHALHHLQRLDVHGQQGVQRPPAGRAGLLLPQGSSFGPLVVHSGSHMLPACASNLLYEVIPSFLVSSSKCCRPVLPPDSVVSASAGVGGPP